MHDYVIVKTEKYYHLQVPGVNRIRAPVAGLLQSAGQVQNFVLSAKYTDISWNVFLQIISTNMHICIYRRLDRFSQNGQMTRPRSALQALTK